MIPSISSMQPHLPKLLTLEKGVAPRAPERIQDTGIESQVLADLVLKTAFTVPQFSTEWLAQRVHLPQPMVAEILEHLRADHLLEVLGQAGPFGFRYTISQRGRDLGQRALEISGYIGPAPVSLEAYRAFLVWQMDRMSRPAPGQVAETIRDLTLTPEIVQLTGLAVSSGRSLFLHGPPGNGKTHLARLLYQAMPGTLWIPYCLNIDHSIITVFDPQVHRPETLPLEQQSGIDQRWICIRRPLIIGGGETTLHSFDLNFSSVHRYYQAPQQLKANGGTFLIDDFGRQRVEPHQLINRWIIPLENQVDYLTLITGQKIQVPFRQMVIIATNLKPESVTDPAFLRRMGYRIRLDNPTADQYAQIFERYAQGRNLAVPPGLVDKLLERYCAERRDLRGCEPRDLIERACDICVFFNQEARLSQEIMDLAWAGYFGTAQGK